MQCRLSVPLPILEDIICFSAEKEKLSFRATCKLLKAFIDKKFFPTFTTTLTGTFLGHKDGFPGDAKLYLPHFGVLDSSETFLYFSEYFGHVIRRLDLSTNFVTTLCGTPLIYDFGDGVGLEARFHSLSGIVLNEEDKEIYVSDCFNRRIRRVHLIDNKVDTLCETRNDKQGRSCPQGLAFDSVSKCLYLADSTKNIVAKISVKDPKLEILCGCANEEGYLDGSFEEAKFNVPYGIVLNSRTEELYVTDHGNHLVRVISLKDRSVRTLCGTPNVEGYEDGLQHQSKFKYPKGIALDTNFNCLYVTDSNHVVRRIYLSGEVSTLCGHPESVKGNKDGLHSSFRYPAGIVVDKCSESLYVMDSDNHRIRKVKFTTSPERENLSQIKKKRKLF